MKSTLIQVLFFFFSYSELISAVQYQDPLEEYLKRERQQEAEYQRQQEELRVRFEQQKLEQLRQLEQQRQLEQHQQLVFQDATDIGSDLLPTAAETETGTLPFETSTTGFMTTTLNEQATTTQGERATTTSSRHREMQNTCCRLGDRAGRSGFLCTPENYRPQLSLSHGLFNQGNFKISRSQREQYVERRQFTKCISGAVASLSAEFQRCCKQAYVDTLDEEVIGVSREDDSDMPIMLELPLQIDIISKQRKHPRTHRKSHIKV